MADFDNSDNPFAKYVTPSTPSTDGAEPVNPFAKYVNQPAKPRATIASMAGDVGRSLKAGVEELPGAVTGLADLVPALVTGTRPFTTAADWIGEKTGFQPGKWAKETQFSPSYQQDQKEVNDAWKGVNAVSDDPNASNADYWSKLAADAPGIAKAYLTHPMYPINQVARSAPSMLAGGALSRGLMVAGRVAPVAENAAAGVAARAAVPGYLERHVGSDLASEIAGGVGEGAMQAGQQMDQYQGDDQRRNAIAALGSGALDAGIAFGAGHVAHGLGWETANTAMAQGLDNKIGAAGSAIKRIAGGAASEGILQELPQSMQEQVWQNYADNKPLTQGVAQQGVEGAISGAVMGVGANLRPERAHGAADQGGQSEQTAPPAGPSVVPPTPQGVSADDYMGPSAPNMAAPAAGPLTRAASLATGSAMGGQLFPFSDLAGAQKQANSKMQETGIPHEAVDHPEAPGRFAAVPVQLTHKDHPFIEQAMELGLDPSTAEIVATGQEGADLFNDVRAYYSEVTPQQWRDDPAARANMAAAFLKRETEQLGQLLGAEPTPIESYIARQVGVNAAANMLTMDPAQQSMQVSEVVPDVERAKRAGIEGMQVGEALKMLAGRAQAKLDKLTEVGDGNLGTAVSAPNQPTAGGHGDAAVGNTGRTEPVAGGPATTGNRGSDRQPGESGANGFERAGAGAVDDPARIAASLQKAGGWETPPGPSTAEEEERAAAVDAQAHTAAASPQNDHKPPTPEQIAANNYKTGKIDPELMHGLRVGIENPVGTTRRSKDPSNPWETTMQDHYGRFTGTVGADGDAIDTFIGPNPASTKVFVVDQTDPKTGKFDEHKVMLGYNSLDEARQAYARNYAKDWQGGKTVTETTVDGFKDWLKTGDTTKEFAPTQQQAAAGAPAATAGESQPAPAVSAEQGKPDWLTEQQRGLYHYHAGRPSAPEKSRVYLGKNAEGDDVYDSFGNRIIVNPNWTVTQYHADPHTNRIPQSLTTEEVAGGFEYAATKGEKTGELQKVMPGTRNTPFKALDATAAANDPTGKIAQRVAQLDAKLAELRQQQKDAEGVGNAWVYDGQIKKAETELAEWQRALDKAAQSSPDDETKQRDARRELNNRLDDVGRKMMAEKQAAMLATQAQHEAMAPRGTNADGFAVRHHALREFAYTAPGKYAQHTADEFRANPELYAKLAKVTPDDVRRFADVIEQQLASGEKPVKAKGQATPAEGATVNYPNRQLGFQYTAVPQHDAYNVNFWANIAAANMKVGDTFTLNDKQQTVESISGKTLKLKDAEGNTRTYNPDGVSWSRFQGDMGRQLYDEKLKGGNPLNPIPGARKLPVPLLDIFQRDPAVHRDERGHLYLKDGGVVDAGNQPAPSTTSVRERLKAIAKRIGVAVREVKGGFASAQGAVEIPAEDAQVAGALSPEHVFAHELGHAVLENRRLSFSGFPKKEMLRWVPNWDELVAASKAYRPEVWNHKDDRIRRHASKPNEVLADAIGAVLLGEQPLDLLKPLMGKGRITVYDLGLEDATKEGIKASNAALDGGHSEQYKSYMHSIETGNASAGMIEQIKMDERLHDGEADELLDMAKIVTKSEGAPVARPLDNATAPEHVQVGVDDRELHEIVAEFNAAQAGLMTTAEDDEDDEDGEGGGGQDVTNIFMPPKKNEIVRLNDKAKVYHKDHGWMTPKEAKAKIEEWKKHAQAQYDNDDTRTANSQKVVLSLFDLTGKWSEPWEQAGYQVYRFDIQDDSTYEDPETGEEKKIGDVHNMSVEFFNDIFGGFDGNDVYAILAACPCTDFAVSGARHFAAKDADGRTVASVKLVHQTLAAIEYFKPSVWALENPVGRIESLGGLPPWRLSFDPNHLGDPYTKKTLIWGRFNADLPIAPVEPTEGSKMHRLYGGKSQATKNARSETPEGFSYAFFMANNAADHPAMAIANKYDRLDRDLIEQAVSAGATEEEISDAVDDLYYFSLDDDGANDALRQLIAESKEFQAQEAANPVSEEAKAKMLADLPQGAKFVRGSGLRKGEWAVEVAGVRKGEFKQTPEAAVEEAQRYIARLDRIKAEAERQEANDAEAEYQAGKADREAAPQPGSADDPLKFYSGMSRPGDFTKLFAEHRNVGITIKELSAPSIPRIAQAMAKSNGHLFVDSGAFPIYQRNERAFREALEKGWEDWKGEEVLPFDQIMSRYNKLYDAINTADDGGFAPDRAYFVMPDVIGRQDESLRLVGQFARDIKSFGANAIVPLQSGELSLTKAYESMMLELGLDPDLHDGPRIGIPSNALAVSNEELTDLLKKHGDSIPGVHILGAVSDARLAPRLDAIRAAGYEGDVSADANRLRALMYGERPRDAAWEALLAESKPQEGPNSALPQNAAGQSEFGKENPNSEIGKEISRYTGQYGEGMGRPNAAQYAAQQRKANPQFDYTVEDAEDEFGAGRYVVVQREKVTAPAVAEKPGLAKMQGAKAEKEQAKHDIPAPPTMDYRLTEHGGQTYLVPPVGKAFTKEVNKALRDWLNDAGYSASFITDSKVSVSEKTGGPSLDLIEDGVEAQRIEREIERDKARAEKDREDFANQPKLWSDSPFAPRIQSLLDKLVAAGQEGYAKVINGGFNVDAKNGQLDEAKTAFREENVRKYLLDKGKEGQPVEPVAVDTMTADKLAELTNVAKVLPQPIVDAAVARWNALAPELGKQGFRNYDDVHSNNSPEARAAAQKLREILNALDGLAARRYQEAKGHKNLNPDAVKRNEQAASDTLGIDTTAYPGIDTSRPVTLGGGVQGAPNLNADRNTIAQRYADVLAREGVSNKVTDFHLRFADALLAKDAYGLGWITNGMNDKSKKVFAEFTGVKLPRGQAASWEALKEWAGVTPEQDAAVQAKAQAARASKAREDADKAVESAAESRRFQVNGGDTVDGKTFIDQAIAAGFNSILNVSKTPIPRYVLANKDKNQHYPLDKISRAYAELALRRLGESAQAERADADGLESVDDIAAIAEEHERELADAKAKGQTMASDDDLAHLFGKEKQAHNKQASTTEDEHGPDNAGDQGSQALGALAPGQSEGAQGGRGVRAGNPGGGTQGAGRNQRPDGAGVPGARSGGSGTAAVHPAQAGAAQGRLGEPGAGQEGTRVPENDVRVPGLVPAAPNVPGINFRITPSLRLGQGGETAKFNDNLTAIRTLKAIEADNRRATPEEQALLARYVGWGGLAAAFPNPETGAFRDGWAQRGADLEALLSPKEYALARRSTLDSHYTSETVVNSMWQAAERLGFRGGLALESSVGVGNFLGLMPEQVSARTRFIGVEYDSLTSRIAGLLYPNETILNSGFQDVPLPDGQFDLAIGNPPFGEQHLRFQFKPEFNRFSIHNQFFLASLDAVKPGGLQIQVVSRYLMDAQDPSARIELAKRAKLLGAIRLPDTAFKENARTSVVTDIVFLQRLTAAEEATMEAAFEARSSKEAKTFDKEKERKELAALVPDWINVARVPDPLGGEAIPASAYFAANPNMVLGTLERSGKMNFKNDITVRPDESRPLDAQLAAAIARLPRNVMVQEPSAVDIALERYANLADGLQIALAGQEAGSIRLHNDGTLQQVIERETPDGQFELTRRTLTAASPWSAQLQLDSNGKWYKTEVMTGEDGKPLKLVVNGKATKRNQYEKVVYDDLSQIPSSLLLGKAKYERLRQMVGLRDLLVQQLNLEAEDASEKAINANRKELAKAYRAFVDQHGLISEPSNSSLLSDMPDGALVQALESGYRPAISAKKAAATGEKERAATAKPAAILSKRVIVKYVPPTSAASLADAIAIQTAESGNVDLERIAQLLGKSVQETQEEIDAADHPLLFLDPEQQAWVTRDEYLSGTVKRKLEAARAAGMGKNASELEAVLPEQWGAENVTVLLGSAWVPPSVYQDFLRHITGSQGHVSFSRATNAFTVVPGPEVRANEEEWGSDGISAATIINDTLNSRAIKVMTLNLDGKPVVDEERTKLALLKARAINNEFSDWVFADGERRNLLVETFNDKFNTRTKRQHDGSHLFLPGKVPDAVIRMRRHQKNAIWRGIVERFLLLDHAVGAGKTYTAIARAMERRRMGLAKKPMIVVPNHMVEQFTADTYRLYPGAKVLAAGKKDFEKSRRRKLFAKIATGDYDVIIVPHSSFGFIGISPETEARYLDQELRIAEDAIKEAEEEAIANGQSNGRTKPFGVKEAERLRDKITARMHKIKGDNNKDKLLTFEQMGVDDLTVDEAHEFKNLFYSSRLTSIKGMGNKTGSQKAFDLYNKVRVMRESPKGAVTFMTGTPISNSAVEMYTMMRYLAADELRDLGLEHFDAWRAQYVSTDAAWEPTETGRLKEVNRLGRTWSNMRSLMDLYYGFTDAVSNDDIKKAYREDNDGAEFPIPKVKGGDRQSVVVQPTKAQIELLDSIMAGFDNLPNIQDPYDRNIQRLRLMDRARKVSLDVRAVDPSNGSKEVGGKLDRIADEVSRLYQKWDAQLGTQLIFLDRSVPKSKGDDKILREYDALLEEQEQALREDDEATQRRVAEQLEKFDPDEMDSLRAAQTGGWNAYQQLKDNLIARGIPANEIRFVQEANNDEQKQALFDAVNDGRVRVLIGSTPRMGAGTNVQQRLVGLHHADVTWKPSDIEQREGRIIRQGNLIGFDENGAVRDPNFEVEILAYATERTIDAKMWNLNATKLRTINGIRNYDGAFSMDFEDADSVSMAELAALASGDPLLLERVKLMSDIDRLELLKRQHTRKNWGITSQIEDAQRDIKRLPGQIEAYRADVEALKQAWATLDAQVAQRTVVVEGQTYDSPRAALAAARAAMEAQQAGDENAKFSIRVDTKRATSMNGVNDAITAAFGERLQAEVNGDTLTQRVDLQRVAANRATDMAADLEKGQHESVILGTMLGMPLELSVQRSAYFDSYTATLALLRPDGSTLAAGETKEGKDRNFTTARMANPVGQLEYQARPDEIEHAIDSAKRRLAAAEKALPELLPKQNTPFAEQGELDAKMARLEDVIRQLANKPSAVSSDGNLSAQLRAAELAHARMSAPRQPPLKVAQPETPYGPLPGEPGYTDPYEKTRTRPGTTEAQRNTGRAAVADLARRIGALRYVQGDNHSGSQGTLLGLSLLDNFVAGEPNQLRGQVVKSPADLAALAQVYRDPNFETFRVAYMRGNQVVGEAGFGARNSGAVTFPADYLRQIADDMDAFGADGYYIMHNHPNGEATASTEDRDLTQEIAEAVPGFLSHVIIDHNEYGVIDRHGNVQVIRDDTLNGVDFHGKPSVPHALLGTVIHNPAAVAKLAKSMQIQDGHATLVMTTADKVSLIVDVPMAGLMDTSPAGIMKGRALLRAMSRAGGASGKRFLVLPDGADAYALRAWGEQKVVTDIVTAGGLSLASQHIFKPAQNYQDIARGKRLYQPEEPYKATSPLEGKPNEVAKRVGAVVKAQTVTRVGNALVDKRPIGLQFLGRRQLVQLYGYLFPQPGGRPNSMAAYENLAMQQDAEVNEGKALADEIAVRWGKLKDHKALAELMHDATLDQIDPRRPRHPAVPHYIYQALRNRYEKLTPEAKKIFNDASAAYEKHYEAVKMAIRNRIVNALPDHPGRASLLSKMDAELFHDWKGIYFPLARFGDYIVRVRGPEGTVESLSMAETMSEAKATHAAMLKEYGGKAGYEVMPIIKRKEFNAARDAVGRGFLQQLYGVIENSGKSEATAELLDSINQLYLTSLPDLSWAKHGIHRKGTPGFSQDARRAFAHNMSHGARYLAKLHFADRLSDRVDEMQDYVNLHANDPKYNAVKAQQVVDEMVKRHDVYMNPNTHPLATALTSAGFVFYLGLSPASAAVNLSQTAMVAYPILGGKYGYGKSAAALLRASKDAVSGHNDMSKVLKGDELAAYQHWVNIGLIDVSQAHDLAGIADGNDSKVWGKLRPVMKAASFMFHHAERFNRQATALAVYRLARDKGLSHEAAMDAAIEDTYAGHFDYSAGNRPRIMQGNVARVVLLFKQYAQNMIYTFSHEAAKALKGDKAAMKTLSGLLVTHALGAGVLGLPAVTMLLAAASSLGSDPDEPWDAQVALRNLFADAFGDKAGEVLAHGLSRLTPWDISGRVGLDHLILPDVQEGLEGQRWAESWAAGWLGPVAGAGVNLAKGMHTIASGDLQRGLEELAPAAARGPLRSLRYATQGVQDKTGIEILPETTLAENAGQALGFSPSRAREAQEAKSAVYQADQALLHRRQELMNTFARAQLAQEDTGPALEAIRNFNALHPNRQIAALHLQQSVKARMRRIQQAEQGIYLPANRRDARAAGAFATPDE